MKFLLCPRRRSSLGGALAFLFAIIATRAVAHERLQRRFGVDEGLGFSEIFSLAQDSRGFIWIETPGRIYRYDGIEMRPWPRSSPGALGGWVSAGPDGQVLVTDYLSRLYEVGADDLVPLPGPEGRQAVASWPPKWDGTGRLWLVSDGRIWIRSGQGTWTQLPLARTGSESPYGIEKAGGDEMLALSPGGIWRLTADQDGVRLASLAGVMRALLRPDGSMAVLVRGGRLLEIRDGVARDLYQNSYRPIDMVQRGDTLWVSYDAGLAALRPGQPPEWLGEAEDVPGGGVLLVDREESLWVGTYRGLRQFPAPDTIAYGPGARRLTQTREGIWLDTWNGLSLMRSEAGAYRREAVPDTATSALCTAPDGTMWAGDRDRFLERRDGRFIEHAHPGLQWVRDCAVGPKGDVWMTTNAGLVVAQPPRGAAGSTLRMVAWPPGIGGNTGGEVVLVEASGRVWIAADERICRSESRELLADAPADWSCATMEGAGGVTDLAALPSGSVWACTLHGGVFRWDPASDRWAALPGSRQLPTLVVRRLRPSPSGGMWVISFGTIVRVVERPESAEGWEIVERPSAWQGLMISDAEDLLEEPAGDLWITTLAGLVHVPPEVRRSVPAPPTVELVDVLQGSARITPGDGLTLPWRMNRIELRFAALSYRDPGRLRYQVRLHPEAAWADASGPPAFRFVDLPAGSYQVEVRASLDGKSWSAAPAGISFVVLPPFWRTWWFLALAAAALAGMAYALYRYRLGQALGLERIRTHIATDLHDDIGASLSQIAILNEVALTRLQSARGDAAGLLAAAAQSARELVDSMSDVVWAVDPKRDTLEDLVLRMRRFAEEMCEAREIDLRFAAPPDGARHLDARVRRQIHLLFKESVNNAVKHSGCSVIQAELRLDGSRLELRVADDGGGFDPEAAHEGHGLASMRRRSEGLGGAMGIRSTRNEGTQVTFSVPI